ncbi:hypothetical protein IGI04_018794 [Brassica rapa subsp. trilocularis]|uniref:Uncharacterized protein n=1 Tax=Brassica rapa subsp. trilocularis TaxID=1813537 RepID=A0ABQ7MF17_BRACM|nr:hypothetical protein IGI04_018794 [Brassica rapa subsp. trilocularis]
MCQRVQRKDAYHGGDDTIGLVVSIQLGYVRSKKSSIQIVTRNIRILQETSQSSFPKKKLEFSSKVVMCASTEVLRMYIAWRQQVAGGDGIVGLVLGCLDERHREWHDAFDIHNFAM